MSLEFALLCIQEYSTVGGEIVCLSGGEPLTHPEFAKIVQAAKQSGLRVQATTNGTLLDTLPTDILRGLDAVHLSLMSLDPFIYESISRPAMLGLHSKILGNVELLKSNNIDTTINTILLADFPEEAKKLVDYALKNGLKAQIMNNMLVCRPANRLLN